MASEDFYEIVVDCMSKLLLSGGGGTIWILKICDGISSRTLDDRLVEKGSISVTGDRLFFLVSLAVKSFLFG